MAVQHEDELRREIAAGRVTVILGAGVSMAATGGAATASWIGLLTDGIDRCVAVVPGLPARWPDSMRNLLDLGREGDPEALLSVAEQITVKLGGPAGGELKRWLRETVGSLRVRHHSVPRTVGSLTSPSSSPRVAYLTRRRDARLLQDCAPHVGFARPRPARDASVVAQRDGGARIPRRIFPTSSLILRALDNHSG